MSVVPVQSLGTHSRTALIVQGAGLAAVAGGLLGSFTVSDTPEWYVPLGCGLAAATVLWLWSMLLSAKALRAGERWRVPLSILALGTLELLSLGVGAMLVSPDSYRILDRALESGVPLFGGVFVFTVLLVAPVAWWKLRKNAAEQREPGQQRRTWLKLALLTVCVYLVLLPAPLFIYCALLQLAFERPDGQESWMKTVTRHTPTFLGEGCAALVQGTNFFPGSGIITPYASVLSTGAVSKDRLLAELNSADPCVSSAALDGLAERDLERSSRTGRKAVARRT